MPPRNFQDWTIFRYFSPKSDEISMFLGIFTIRAPPEFEALSRRCKCFSFLCFSHLEAAEEKKCNKDIVKSTKEVGKSPQNLNHKKRTHRPIDSFFPPCAKKMKMTENNLVESKPPISRGELHIIDNDGNPAKKGPFTPNRQEILESEHPEE